MFSEVIMHSIIAITIAYKTVGAIWLLTDEQIKWPIDDQPMKDDRKNLIGNSIGYLVEGKFLFLICKQKDIISHTSAQDYKATLKNIS
jgi:hypothetical protein